MPTSLPKGCPNVWPRSCASWTSRATKGKPDDAHTAQTARSRSHRRAGTAARLERGRLRGGRRNADWAHPPAAGARRSQVAVVLADGFGAGTEPSVGDTLKEPR